MHVRGRQEQPVQVVQVVLYPVEVPVVAPRHHAGGTTTHLVRTVIEVITDDGQVGLGEVGARVPVELTQAAAASLIGRNVHASDLLDALDIEHVRDQRTERILAAGFSIARADLLASEAGLTVGAWLEPRSVRSRLPAIVYLFPTDATVDQPACSEPTDLAERAARLCARTGCRTVKLKAGVADAERDLATLRALRARLPDVALRVDPNGVWQFDDAVALAAACDPLGLEWIEDPVSGAVQMRRFREHTGARVATNMTITHSGDLADADRRASADVVLLDLWFAGGYDGVRDLTHGALDLGLELGIHAGGGGTAELGVGLAAALHLASTLPELAPAVDTMLHDTVDDIVQPRFAYANGHLTVPRRSGLGVTLDRAALSRYATSTPIEQPPYIRT